MNNRNIKEVGIKRGMVCQGSSYSMSTTRITLFHNRIGKMVNVWVCV